MKVSFSQSREALETVKPDENSQSGFQRSYKYPGGEAACAVFGVELFKTGGAA
jgi:hypothetical protein